MATLKELQDTLARLEASKKRVGALVDDLTARAPTVRLAAETAPEGKRARAEQSYRTHKARLRDAAEELTEIVEAIEGCKAAIEVAKARAPKLSAGRRDLEKRAEAFKVQCAEIDAEALALADKVRRTLGTARELGVYSENLIGRFTARLMERLGGTVGQPHPREGKLPQPLADVADAACRARLAKFDKEAA